LHNSHLKFSHVKKEIRPQVVNHVYTLPPKFVRHKTKKLDWGSVASILSQSHRMTSMKKTYMKILDLNKLKKLHRCMPVIHKVLDNLLSTV